MAQARPTAKTTPGSHRPWGVGAGEPGALPPRHPGGSWGLTGSPCSLKAWAESSPPGHEDGHRVGAAAGTPGAHGCPRPPRGAASGQSSGPQLQVLEAHLTPAPPLLLQVPAP